MMKCVKRRLQKKKEKKEKAIFQLLTITLGSRDGLAILKFMPIQCSANRKPSIKARETLKVNNK